tara:strand:- start:4698 stop:5075 length:378 start_codon:yes stop_codon:yes gene_type:complete
MLIKLKYKKPLTPGAQINLNFGYPIMVEALEKKTVEDEYGATYIQEDTVQREKHSIFLDKTKEVELPLCFENVEAIGRLTAEIFVFADSHSQRLYEESIDLYTEKKPKKLQKPTPKKDKLEAQEL